MHLDLEPHRLDGGEMSKEWYIKAWTYSCEDKRVYQKENIRLRKLLRRLSKLASET